jgi:hypothetical protein
MGMMLMNSSWYDMIFNILTASYQFFRDLYNGAEQPLLKMLFLGEASVFTPSMLAINLFFITYIVRQMNNRWFLQLLYILMGKVAGTFVLWFFLLRLSDVDLLSSIAVMRKGLAIALLLIGLYSFVSIGKELLKIPHWFRSIALGFIFAFYIDPTVFSHIRSSPIFFEISFSAVTTLFLFSVTMLTPLFLVAIVLYGFELDRWIQRKFRSFLIVTSIVYLLLAINELIIYWG